MDFTIIFGHEQHRYGIASIAKKILFLNEVTIKEVRIMNQLLR